MQSEQRRNSDGVQNFFRGFRPPHVQRSMDSKKSSRVLSCVNLFIVVQREWLGTRFSVFSRIFFFSVFPDCSIIAPQRRRGERRSEVE